jgi:hypothetical protein
MTSHPIVMAELPPEPSWHAPPATRATGWERRARAAVADAKRLRELLALREARHAAELEAMRAGRARGRAP